jgi:nucleotide-binding universal stress UspA family protein
MNRILVATDFSPHAQRALEHAARFAELFDASLELLTSAWLPPMVSSDAVPLNVAAATIPQSFIEATRERSQAQLEELAEPLRHAGLIVDCVVTMESPSTAIAARAEEAGADLIALGTRGLSGLKHVVLGSIAERTARTAKCPVLTVHEDAAAPGALRKLLVPTDFSENAERALELAKTIAARAGARLVLQHACHVPVSLESDVWSLDAPVFEGLENEARQRLGEIGTGLETEIAVSRGIPDVEIVEQARASAADLIVIGTRGRTGLAHLVLGSTAERVIRRAPVPVISVGSNA